MKWRWMVLLLAIISGCTIAPKKILPTLTIINNCAGNFGHVRWIDGWGRTWYFTGSGITNPLNGVLIIGIPAGKTGIITGVTPGSSIIDYYYANGTNYNHYKTINPIEVNYYQNTILEINSNTAIELY